MGNMVQSYVKICLNINDIFYFEYHSYYSNINLSENSDINMFAKVPLNTNFCV